MKKTTISILVIIATMITNQVKSQDSLFDLKNYKTTNYERSSLDLQFNLNEVGAKSNSEKSSSSLKETNNSFNTELDLESEYSKVIQSEKQIINYGSTLSLNETMYLRNYSKLDSATDVSYKTFNYQGDHEIDGFYDLNLYYSPTNKNFLIVGASASVNHNKYTSSLEKTFDNKYSETEVGGNIAIKIGHGHGRIENVEDAVEALYLLKELSEEGLLLKKYSQKDIKALADKITLVKKDRYFDQRLYRKKSMKVLVSFLEELGLISKGDIDIFNTITDYHYYAGIIERLSGQKIEYYVRPSFMCSNEIVKITDTDVKQEINSYSGDMDFVAYYYNNKPISIKWQRNIYANINMSYTKIKDGASSFVEDKMNFTNSTYLQSIANAGFSYGYYPSTRSNISAGLYVNGVYSNDISDESLTEEPREYFNAGFYMNAYYYLSQQLRISGIFSLNSNMQKLESIFDDVSMDLTKNQNILNNLTITLTYSFF